MDNKDYILGLGVIGFAFVSGAVVATVVNTKATIKHMKKMKAYDDENLKNLNEIVDLIKSHDDCDSEEDER